MFAYDADSTNTILDAIRDDIAAQTAAENEDTIGMQMVLRAHGFNHHHTNAETVIAALRFHKRGS